MSCGAVGTALAVSLEMVLTVLGQNCHKNLDCLKEIGVTFSLEQVQVS